MKFSANLGFLWNDVPLPKAIQAAKLAGFDAVECHWPYDEPPEKVLKALTSTGLIMLGLNTPRGNVATGDNGLAALPGREKEARATIDQALDYAKKIRAENIHVMAGFSRGEEARTTFISNLRYACNRAYQEDIKILIEPLNKYDTPGYFLRTTDQAVEIIREVGSVSLKLMFDCYHVQLMEGNLTNRIKELLPLIGHIQFAAVPNRTAPGHGEIDYTYLFSAIKAMGWQQPLGAEYKSGGNPLKSMDWLYRAKSL